MHHRFTLIVSLVLTTTTLAVGQDTAPPIPASAPAVESGAELDVLTRGPVHEAFAEQSSPNPRAGIIASTAPPEPVNEVPPDMRPEGDDVIWISGYWFWDDERDDYIWVSGVWRRVPPGRRWVPGYWQTTAAGCQWIAGFWSSDAADDVEYLDVPPESLESGPSSPAPSDDYFWMPGTWSWSLGRYRWRPGTWCVYRDNWTWVTARYVWTPRGCIYVPGYWDYPVTLRGHLFAPVYYRSPIFLSAGYTYRPTCWIGYESMLLHLFVRPRYHHLYFGDYYAPRYRQLHYTSCYSYHAHHPGYASLYVYYQHHYRQFGIDYCRRVSDWHHYYVAHADDRPAHIYGRSSHRRDHDVDRPRHHHDVIGRPYDSRAGDHLAGHRLVPVSRELNTEYRHRSDDLRKISRQRRQFEVTKRTPTTPKRPGSAAQLRSHGRLTLPKLPTASHAVAKTRTTTPPHGRRSIPSDILRANRATRSQMVVRTQDSNAALATPPRGTTVANDARRNRDTLLSGNLGDLTSRGHRQSKRVKSTADVAANRQKRQSKTPHSLFRPRTTPPATINRPPLPSKSVPSKSTPRKSLPSKSLPSRSTLPGRGRLQLPLTSGAVRRGTADPAVAGRVADTLQRRAAARTTPSRSAPPLLGRTSGPIGSAAAGKRGASRIGVPTAPHKPPPATIAPARPQRSVFGRPVQSPQTRSTGATKSTFSPSTSSHRATLLHSKRGRSAITTPTASAVPAHTRPTTASVLTQLRQRANSAAPPTARNRSTPASRRVTMPPTQPRAAISHTAASHSAASRRARLLQSIRSRPTVTVPKSSSSAHGPRRSATSAHGALRERRGERARE